MKTIKKIETLEGQTTHGDVKNQINQAIDDINANFDEGGAGGANLTGYATVASEGQLPSNSSSIEKTLGYLIGTDLYVYVGKGGTTADGKYKNCGPFRGPKGDAGAALKFSDLTEEEKKELKGEPGAPGEKGDKGDQGNSGYTGAAGELQVVNNLTQGGETAALSAQQGKVLKKEIEESSNRPISFTDTVEKRIDAKDKRNEAGGVAPNGKDLSIGNWNRTPFLPCAEGGSVTIYTDAMYGGVATAFYSSNTTDSFISSKSTDIKGETIPIPKGAKFFRTSLKLYISQSYCIYTESITKKPLDSTLREFDEKIDIATQKVDDVAKDLIVKEERRTIRYTDLTEDDNGAVNKQGIYESKWGPNWRVTPYTLCVGGSKARAYIPGLSNYLSVSFYSDKSENSFVKSYCAIEFEQDISIPQEAKYMRASLQGISFIIFDYKEIITDIAKKNAEDIEILGQKIKDIPGYAETEIQATWEAIGTSITWYNDHIDEGKFTKGYITRVNEVVKFRHVVNQGYSGSPIGGSYGLAGNLHRITKADYYTIEHGINDFGDGIPVGTMDDFKNNTGFGTFYGAYRIVIDKIYSLNPKAKIILCTPRKAYGPWEHWYDKKNGQYFHQFADAVIEIAKFMSFPVCDWFNESQANQETLASLSIDVAVHPNDDGYQDMANLLIDTFHKLFRGAKIIDF